MAVEMHKNYCAHAPNLKNRGKRAVAKNGVLRARNVHCMYTNGALTSLRHTMFTARLQMARMLLRAAFTP
jgi:hypothetical protein